jgi:ribosomal protein S18 acetylase RimI-like enzyme
MAHADKKAIAGGHRGVSLIVSDANPGARRLYERLGYEAVASLPMVKEQWEHDGEHWILMIKALQYRESG